MSGHSMEIVPFRVGRVLSRSLSILFRNILPFLLLALVISSPTFVYTILKGPEDIPMVMDPLEYLSELGAEPFILSFVGLFLGYLVTAALVYGTFQDLKNEPVSIGECFAKGIALIFPVFGVALVNLLILLLVLVVSGGLGAVILGLLLAATESALIGVVGGILIMLPTVYVWIMLWVTIPVAVIERRGLGSIKRSAALTKGYRWRLFGLLILLLAVAFAVGMLISLLTEPILDGGVSTAYFTGQTTVNWLISEFFSVLSAVIVAISYNDLRVAKEGVDTDHIASVFD